MRNLGEPLEEMMLDMVSTKYLRDKRDALRRLITYPVFIINGNAQFAKTAHAPTSDKIENVSVRHPRSPPSVV
jgi:hypothetical protein